MEPSLSPLEVRVLACLIEKALSTPEYYPLTLNALTAACNQKSNREPVMQVSDVETVGALDALRDRHLSSSITLAGSRAPKYRHRIEAAAQFDGESIARTAPLDSRGSGSGHRLFSVCLRRPRCNRTSPG